jgi:hypothetical protein
MEMLRKKCLSSFHQHYPMFDAPSNYQIALNSKELEAGLGIVKILLEGPQINPRPSTRSLDLSVALVVVLSELKVTLLAKRYFVSLQGEGETGIEQNIVSVSYLRFLELELWLHADQVGFVVAVIRCQQNRLGRVGFQALLNEAVDRVVLIEVEESYRGMR